MIKIDLSELVKSPETNSISGRSFGEKFAVSKKLLDHVQQNEKILIVIDDSKVKAINDSFIKGFFSQVFEKLKTREKVKALIEIQANNYYVRLFDKNWTILEAINKA